MLNIRESYINEIISRSESEIASKKVKIIPMTSYLDTMLKDASSRGDISYPYKINIPHSIRYMLKTGDFSPKKTIVIEKPFMYDSNPIWTKSSLKGIDLGFGYKNGDKRYLSEIKLGDPSANSGPHMLVGGKTGGGKSVFVNNLIFNILYGYSPFEVNLTLIDAKIAEFKRYSNTHHVPHVRTIGATSDTSYVISVLKDMLKKMDDLNKLFGAVGVSNLEDFRKETGLALPREILFVDEYQLQYENASTKESAELTSCYNKLCVAGRSAGIHLILCSQSYLEELKSKLFHNIEIRVCLSCAEKTSEGILNNKVASDKVPIGEVHVNLAVDQSIEGTAMYKVPFQNSANFKEQGLFLEECAKSLDCEFPTNFYDEESVLTYDSFKDLVNIYGKQDRLVLGSPSFAKESEVDVFYFDQKFEDVENILLFSPDASDVKEYLSTLNSNFARMKPSETRCNFLVADKSLMKDISIPSFASSFPCTKTEDPSFKGFMGVIYRKNMILEVDELIFSGNEGSVNAEVVKVLKDKYGDSSSICNSLNYSRISWYYNKLNDKTYSQIIDSNLTELILKTHALVALEELMKFSQNFINTKIDSYNVPTHYFVIVGMDKLRGIGRDGNYKKLELLKNMMFDAFNSKCCIICLSTNISDASSLKSAFGYVITSNSKSQESKMGVELPNNMPKILSCFIKPALGDVSRFKRLNMFDR